MATKDGSNTSKTNYKNMENTHTRTTSNKNRSIVERTMGEHKYLHGRKRHQEHDCLQQLYMNTMPRKRKKIIKKYLQRIQKSQENDHSHKEQHHMGG